MSTRERKAKIMGQKYWSLLVVGFLVLAVTAALWVSPCTRELSAAEGIRTRGGQCYSGNCSDGCAFYNYFYNKLSTPQYYRYQIAKTARTTCAPSVGGTWTITQNPMSEDRCVLGTRLCLDDRDYTCACSGASVCGNLSWPDQAICKKGCGGG